MKYLTMCSNCLTTYDKDEPHTLEDCVKNLNKQVKDLQVKIHELRERLAEYEDEEE